MFELFPENEYDFLSECELFTPLPDKILQPIFKRGRIIELQPGEELFTSDTPPEALYIVKSGVIEVYRPSEKSDEMVAVAYLGRGDSIGELSMLTGSNHTSAARAPEGGEVFELTRRTFRGLLETFPEFAVHLCFLFAQRLESTVKNMGIQRKRQFHGHLKYFDIASVIQTIITSRMTGRLTVTDDLGNPFTQMFFDVGELYAARLGHLRGTQAFYQLFQPPPVEGTFDFKSDQRAPEEDNAPPEHFQPAMNMLMEAVRMQDELENYRPAVNLEMIYQPQTEELNWTGEESSLVLANDIWYRLHKEQPTVVQLLQEVPSCHYEIYYVLATMLKSGQIA